MARYLHVSNEIASDIESGVLDPGDELPSVRDAANHAGLITRLGPWGHLPGDQ
jgi:DNA-binding transcriptional regulator YhcF (GntR family)